VAGVLFLSNATAGVGIIAIGCLLGIWARTAQAAVHHREVMASLRDHSGS
jgi:hypothetical protein